MHNLSKPRDWETGVVYHHWCTAAIIGALPPYTLGAFGAELVKTGTSQATGVWIIVPVGIGEVLMTTFFSKAKSLPKINQTEEKENWLPPPRIL